MYLAIEMWQESGLSQQQFCTREKLSVKTFGNWLKKYREERGGNGFYSELGNAFIPVELDETDKFRSVEGNQIEITYPSGIRVTCPANIGVQQLKTLTHV